MNTDTFFTIGSTHKICQDYASHNLGECPYVIISDGCSSAKDSDFGSRLLAKAAERNIGKNGIEFFTDTLNLADGYRKTLNLHSEALTSTLIVAKKEKEYVRIQGVGDGVIATKNKNGKIHIIEYKFANNAPYYLRYELDKSLKQIYLDKFSGEFTKTEYFITQEEITESYVSDKINKTFFFSELCVGDFEIVAIMSDGVSSFVRPTNGDTHKFFELIPLQEIVKEVLGFKNFTGEFVQRRCQRMFKLFKEKGWQNTDDFSIGVIHNLY
jgi:hypothetical protein